MSAVHTDLAFNGGPVGANGCGCNTGCQGGTMVFRSVWDRLCRQLFGAMPPGMNSDNQLPDVQIWTDGVAIIDDTYPYSFRVLSLNGDSPKPGDVILYNRKYYVIGVVDEKQ